MRQNPTYYFYDQNDNLERIVDALQEQVTYTYDEEDQPLSVTNQNNHTNLLYL
jgi:YD repeat-containing protein